MNEDVLARIDEELDGQDEPEMDEPTAARAYLLAALGELHGQIAGIDGDDCGIDPIEALAVVQERIGRMLTLLGEQLPAPIPPRTGGCWRCSATWTLSPFATEADADRRLSEHRRACWPDAAVNGEPETAAAALAVGDTGQAADEELTCPRCETAFTPWGDVPVDDGHRATLAAHIASCGTWPWQQDAGAEQ